MENLINVNELAKSAGITLPEQILDPETGELVEMDYNKVKRGLTIVSQVRRQVFQIAKDLHEFFDEKYYLYFGMTKEEASQSLFGLNIRAVQNYQLIYERLGSQYEKFEFLGISKLKEISRIPEEERERLIEDGELHLADGSVITIEEITSQSTASLREKLKAQSLSNKKLKKEIEEADIEHKAEIKHLKKENQELENLLNIEEKDQPYYKKITKLRETRDLLESVQAELYSAFLRLHQISITDENEQCLADIKGVLVANAEKILNAESYFDLSLSEYNERLSQVAQ
ncbi:MAG: hypothetical protein JXK07_10135 [Spirochaetes bacterium]|nr:hypothetical protein [Spirochaetota bacterium]MBN2771243.1 hypothetical protein [Spirochaetota bacterium]